jgi:hypothetical protein
MLFTITKLQQQLLEKKSALIKTDGHTSLQISKMGDQAQEYMIISLLSSNLITQQEADFALALNAADLRDERRKDVIKCIPTHVFIVKRT